ncbi:MAG: M50 family metallopeptidase [Thermoguttaceae bacterium]
MFKLISARYVLAVSVLAFCWFSMQVLHEFGHCVAAWLCGGKVERIVLHPMTFSRTDLLENPSPIFTLLGGVIGGVMIPLAVLGVWKMINLPALHVARFWTGFCFIANGAYVGFDFSTTGPTDAGELISHGVNRLFLVLLGSVFVSFGLLLWNGQAKKFGFGKEPQPVSSRLAYAMLLLTILIIIVEVAYA